MGAPLAILRRRGRTAGGRVSGVRVAGLTNGYGVVGDTLTIVPVGYKGVLTYLWERTGDADVTTPAYVAPNHKGSTVTWSLFEDGILVKSDTLEIGLRPVFTVEIVEPSVEYGDELGVDITSDITLTEAGYPAVVLGDIIAGWLRSGIVSFDGAIADFGNSIIATGTLFHPLYAGGFLTIPSDPIFVPDLEAPTISLAWVPSQLFAGTAITSSDLTRSIDDAGYPTYAGTGTFTLYVDDVATTLPHTPAGGEVIYFTYDDTHESGAIHRTSTSRTVVAVADPIVSAGLTDGGPYGVAASAAVTGATLTMTVTGSPTNRKWVYADQSNVTAGTGPTNVSGATSSTLVVTGGTNVPFGKYVAPAASFDGGSTWFYGTGYLVRKALPAAGSLSSVSYSQEIGNVDRDISGGFTANGNTFTYSIVSAPAGYTIATGSTRRTNTASASSATLTIRATDEYGWYVQVTESVSLIAFALTESGGVASITYGANDPDATVYAFPVSGGFYDGEELTLTRSQITGLTNGHGVNMLPPDPPNLTTDGGTSGTLDPGDVAEAGRAGIWGYPAGNTAPTIATSLRDDSGSLQTSFRTTPYTGDGTEDTNIFAQETDGSTTADSSTVPVAAPVGSNVLTAGNQTFILTDKVATPAATFAIASAGNQTFTTEAA